MKYANLTRTYNGKRTLYEAAREMDCITVRTGRVFGRDRGFWGGSPLAEVKSEAGRLIPEVAALDEPIVRNIVNPVPVLFGLVMDAIEKVWQPDAFHLVFHSSGWDTRIISGAIKRLIHRYGSEWAGDLLFLSNRWEAERFYRVMEAMGWDKSQYVAYTEGEKNEHYAPFVYDAWKIAPFPRPANFFGYLRDWAEGIGLVPRDNVQVFTGLWANEIWYWMFPKVEWAFRMRRKYRIHMIASMPIKGEWVEYPLVTLPILDALRRSTPSVKLNNGNALRRAVSEYAVPEAVGIKRRNSTDGYHDLSPRLTQELDGYYQDTEFGKRVEWEAPSHSGNSENWGRWSMALLTEKLIDSGVECQWL
jgi:hypothetical protein